MILLVFSPCNITPSNYLLQANYDRVIKYKWIFLSHYRDSIDIRIDGANEDSLAH